MISTRDDDMLDLSCFDPERLSEFEDAEIEAELVGTFLVQATAQLSELERAISLADAQQLGNVAHKLKGSAATLGAIRMGALCDELCVMAEDGVSPEARGLHRQLVDSLTCTRTAMTAYLAAPAS